MSNTKSAVSLKPVITLLIENPGKGKNWGSLLRCCAAFGIETIYVVGYDKCDVRGSHGASKHVRLEAFPTHDQASKALTAPLDETTNQGGFELVGLLSPPMDLTGDEDFDDFDRERTVMRERFFYEPAEREVDIVRIPATTSKSGDIAEGTGTETQQTEGSSDETSADKTCWKNKLSFPVHHRTKFPTRTCLVVDKLKRGLPWSLAKQCSSFCHIPHANCNPSGSMLTLEASISIVFHETMNAGWVGHTTITAMESTGTTTTATSNYQGQKYHVEKIHKGGNPSDMETRNRKRKEREDKLKELQDEANAAEQEQSLLFGGTNDGDY